MLYEMKRRKYFWVEVKKGKRTVAVCMRGSDRVWHIIKCTRKKKCIGGEYASVEDAFNAFVNYMDLHEPNTNPQNTTDMKDRRYGIVRRLIVAGFIVRLREIFDVLPKTRAAKDLGINNQRFNKLIYAVDSFLVRELYHFARLIEIEEPVIMQLMHAQYMADKKDLQQKLLNA